MLLLKLLGCCVHVPQATEVALSQFTPTDIKEMTSRAVQEFLNQLLNKVSSSPVSKPFPGLCRERESWEGGAPVTTFESLILIMSRPP